MNLTGFIVMFIISGSLAVTGVIAFFITRSLSVVDGSHRQEQQIQLIVGALGVVLLVMTLYAAPFAIVLKG